MRLLPLKWIGPLGEIAGSALYAWVPGERKKALTSLQIAFPQATDSEREQMARECFRHLCKSALELACIQRFDEKMSSWVKLSDESVGLLKGALARGKGAVVVTGHVGNWELGARRIAHAGFPLHCIAREPSDGRLARLIADFRKSGSIDTIWRSSPHAARRMLSALRSNHCLMLAIDQDTRVQSVFVPFFGKLAATPRGAAALALRTGAVVLVGVCHRKEEGYQVTLKEVSKPELESEAAVVELTAALTRELEQAIRKMPTQWVWMHQRWKTRPC